MLDLITYHEQSTYVNLGRRKSKWEFHISVSTLFVMLIILHVRVFMSLLTNYSSQLNKLVRAFQNCKKNIFGNCFHLVSYPCHPCQSDGAASWVGVSHLQIYEGLSRRFMTYVVVEVFVYHQVNNLQAVLLKASYRVTGDKTRFLFSFFA